MGQVIQFSDYQASLGKDELIKWDSLIPVELALGIEDESECLAIIARYGIGSVHPRALSDGSGILIYLIRICDAIQLNQHILEVEELDDDRAACCIDLIQMLENVSDIIRTGIWSSSKGRQTLYP